MKAKTKQIVHSEAVLANHALLEERSAHHLRFGYDSAAAVQFVLEEALPLHGRVLDVGTGKGRFVIPLARHVRNVTTVDLDAEEQRYARLEAIHAGVDDRIYFRVQDARFLPWPAGRFDAVVSWNVFHHLDDPERVFTEMVRMVKPGGKLVLSDFSPSGFRLMDLIHGAEGRRHPHPPNRFTHWRARLRAKGFDTAEHSQPPPASVGGGITKATAMKVPDNMRVSGGITFQPIELDVDMLDGSPLLDIKPSVPRFDRVENARGGWTEAVDDAVVRQRGQRGFSL